MKVYISSTYRDLRDHRAAVDLTLRRMGHDVVGMEQYVAEGMTPLERCLADVAAADLYVVILGWRYGFRPTGPENPAKRSVTELEYEQALVTGRTVLAFLLDPDAPWAPGAMDAHEAHGGAQIAAFRARVGGAHLAGIFTSPDNLASQVGASVAVQGLGRFVAELALEQTSAGPAMGAFIRGGDLVDTAVGTIRNMVEDAGARSALEIPLAGSTTWWSTRLYLLAALIDSLTDVRRLVFTHADARFAGMASPPDVRAALCAAFPELADVDRALRDPPPPAPRERTVDDVIAIWQSHMAALEPQIKVGVRWSLLRRWLGERLVDRCIRTEPETGLTMVQVQQIVDSPIADVPVERHSVAAGDGLPPRPVEVWVVDRDAFAIQLAREWVRTGLPRTPVR